MKTSLDFSLTSKTEKKDKKNEVITTLEELEGLAIIKAVLNNVIDISRITYRDNASYFNIIIDDNIRKTICRLYFNRTQKYIAFIDNNKEVKKPLNTVDDIFQFEQEIRTKAESILSKNK